MAPVPTPQPQPGDMTVPPTFGWEDIASVLLVVSVVAVVFVLLGAAVASFTRRSEWHDYLGARSVRSDSTDGEGTQEDDVPVSR
jgi:hypothetical protein